MKRILLTSVLVPFGLAFGAGCAVDDGTTGTGNPVNSNSGGDNSMGASGQNSMGTSGDNTSGASGSSNPAGGQGGMNMQGMGGMNMQGMGGAAGMAGGVAGAGGEGGAGGGGVGGCTQADCMDVVSGKSNFGFGLKDSWFITGCDNKQGHDCVTIPTCPNGGIANFEDKGSVANEVFPIGGAMGTTYDVSFKFNGVSEAKYYQGGSWAQPATDVATPGGADPAIDEGGIANNNFYIGGSGVASNYNVMRIRVMDSTGKEVGRYYMNSYPGNSGAESHRTFLLSYAHTIPVPGKGTVEFHLEDSNCHAIDNCGAGNVSDTVCDAARNVPNEPNLVLPAMYTNVKKQAITPAATPAPVLVPLAELNPVTGAKQPWHSQISHFTVTKVVPGK
jgi:hypothetical protein